MVMGIYKNMKSEVEMKNYNSKREDLEEEDQRLIDW